MLLEFSVSNFRSFKDEQTISLLAGLDKKHPGNYVRIGSHKILKCAALYGANASGKSNLVRAFEVMSGFVELSATKMNVGDEIPGIVPFRLSPISGPQPSHFAIKLLIEGTVYHYSFATTASKVLDEQLWAGLLGGSEKLWFSRQFDQAAQEYRWEFGDLLHEGESVLKERTRENGLALSRAAEQNVKAVSTFFQTLAKKAWVLQLSDSPLGLFLQTARRMAQGREFADRVKALIRDADFSIADIAVEEKLPDSETLGALRKLFSESVSKRLDDKEFRVPSIRTIHRVRDTDAAVEFSMEDESNGTQRFFALAGPVVDALEKGALLVVDELDCSMHPLLARKLLELFQSESWNPKGAQLIFTTHDTSLMQPALFRRDQVWLVEKDASGASRLRSLYDYRKPRSTESFQRNYLAGRYGALPSFGPTFEDLETP